MKLKQILIAAFAISLAAGTVSFAQDQPNGSGGGPPAMGTEGPAPGDGAQAPPDDSGQPPADDSGQPPPDQSGAPQGGHGHRGGHHAKMMQIESDLEANPKLVEDPNYLAAHPGLQRMLQRHPRMAQKIEQNPQAFFARFNSRHAGGGGPGGGGFGGGGFGGGGFGGGGFGGGGFGGGGPGGGGPENGSPGAE